MKFAGKDFLSMPAPPGYKAGVGRGAVGFSTSAERGGGDDLFPRRPPQANKRTPGTGAESARFADAKGSDERNGTDSRLKRENTEAEAIYAAIDAKLAPKRRRRPAQVNSAAAPLKSELNNVSIEEWASLPDASDFTHRNKRLREEERSSKRNYAVPDSFIIAQQNEEQRLADIRRRRLMLESMVRAEPHNPEGFIALARLEQEAARHKKARLVIEKGTLMCPKSPEIWLESIALHPSSTEARAIVAKACRACPLEAELWLKAIELQPTSAMKVPVVHEALLNCPESTRLWLMAAGLEEDRAAKQQVLRAALDFLPKEEKLWLALLDAGGTIDSGALAEAQQHCPNSIQIWLLSARQFTDVSEVEGMVTQSIKSGEISRHEFLDLLFSRALQDDTRLIQPLTKALEVSLAEVSGGRTVPEPVRDLVFRAMPQSESMYLEWAKTNPGALKEAVVRYPRSQSLWREYVTAGGDIELALQHCSNADDELIHIVADSLFVRGHIDRAIKVLEARATSPLLLIQLIEYYGYRNETELSRKLIYQGMNKWPECAELYLARARTDPEEQVAAHLKEGLSKVPVENKARPLLWHELIRRNTSPVSRRALLSRAIGQYPHSGDLWLERVRLEKQEGRPVTHVLTDALQHCPSYGLLWWEAILETPESQRKRKLIEAVKGSGGDVEVLIAGALVFISAGQEEKAKEWFMKARGLSPNIGDVGLWMYKYGLADESLEKALCSGIQLREGRIWPEAFKECIARGRRPEEALRESAEKLVNPFMSTAEKH